MNQDASLPITTISDDGNLFVTVVCLGEEDYTGVKVFGQPAKSVTYYTHRFDNVTTEANYWIAYKDEMPDGKTDIVIE